MNFRLIFNILGKALILESIFLLLSMCVGFIYSEGNFLCFLIPILILILVGVPLTCLKVKNKILYVKEGMVTVAFVWVVFSLIGALPFVISKEIPFYIDALFETISGFTTTGASIMENVEIMSKSTMFWRIFTHWIGGMGILVFVLAFLPENSGIMHIFSAEAPGPSSSKFVSRIKHTARILYLMYIALSFIELIMLLCGGLSFYDSCLVTFATAGTGGFTRFSNSISHFNSVYIEMVVACFMFIFGINFNFFILVLTGNFLKAIKSEEFRTYLILVVSATLIIAINLIGQIENFGQAIRYSFFQVTSISSTTGFITADFNSWPALSKGIILVLMIIGASGGSTGGGLKVSRFVILIKSALADLRRSTNPRILLAVRFERKPLAKATERSVRTFFLLYIFIIISSTLLLCFDSFGGQNILTHLSASMTCISNVGPGLNAIGPVGSFAGYSVFSKSILSCVMLAGRLEIFPILILFSTRTWKK